MGMTSQERNKAIDQYQVLVDLIDAKKLDYSKSALEDELSSYKFISWCKCNRFLEFLIILFTVIISPFTFFLSLLVSLIWALLYWKNASNYEKYTELVEKLSENKISPTAFSGEKSITSGEKSITSDAYKLYLVTKWGIQKNEVLSKFVVQDRLFNTIEEAMEYANTLEAEGEMAKAKALAEITIHNDGTWTCPKCAHFNPLPVGKCKFCNYNAN